jgi:PAS domain-containing protein
MTSLESIFNNIDEGLIILTLTGDPIYFNEGAFQIFQKIGVTLRESENIYQVLPGESAERMTRIIADVIEKKETVRSGSNQLGLDGTPLYLDEIYVPSFDDNTITHVNLLLRDNTEAKIYEKKIIGMATELHNLIDQANAVIIGTDTQGYITDWNNHTATLTSYSKNEALTNKCATLLMAAPDQPFFEDLIKRSRVRIRAWGTTNSKASC